ncbi:MAG: electron transfer flavoprotein subunit beta/FixA family protein [Desulfobacterales bacterium]|nr:electron transfer flavoprotein subunit beta/FixA family protein [Desulfobacterales bacterium]
MKIVVCIKQVPETTEVKINPQTNTLMREGVASITNPFDEFALEEALLTKEKHGGEVHVISMGPPQAIEVLKNALALGADKVYLLSDAAFAGADTLATAYTLAKTIEKIGGVDLVICGKQAIDGDTAQVGPGIATRLGIPQLTYVAKVREIDPAKKKIVVERMLENGREVVESSLPAVITVVKDINEPRLPSLLGIKKAAKATIPTWTAKEVGVDENRVGLKGSPTWVWKIFSPEARGGGEVLKGELTEVVPLLVNKLMDLKLIK